MKLIKDTRGITALVMVFGTIVALIAIGWSIDIYRVKVDRQNLSRVADITALSTAIEASGDSCQITDAAFQAALTKTWDVNKGKTNYEIVLTSTPIEKQSGIVRVFAKSVVPLFYATMLSNIEGGTGYSNYVIGEAKCSQDERFTDLQSKEERRIIWVVFNIKDLQKS